jgi:hypothetical protein
MRRFERVGGRRVKEKVGEVKEVGRCREKEG